MKKHLIYLGFGLLALLMACQGTQKNQEAALPNADSVLAMAVNIFQPLPQEAINPDNPVTPEKVALGKQLYFDNRLSLHNTESCNTCHDLATFGVDNKPTSEGDDGKKGTRNSPTTLNAALQFVQFWDGRMKDVEEQAGGPVTNPDEMSMPDEKIVVERLSKIKGYREMFAAAFPGQKNPVTFENMRKAIAAFERTLLTPAKFDVFLSGQPAVLDSAELRGLKTFMDAGCTACHAGPLLGGTMYQKYPLFGTHQEYTGSTTDDTGRMQFTKNEADKYMFKVPQLRNIAGTWPYLHDGSVKELDSTLVIMGKAQLNKQLTPEQVADLVAFLKTLNGTLPADVIQPPAPL